LRARRVHRVASRARTLCATSIVVVVGVSVVVGGVSVEASVSMAVMMIGRDTHAVGE
jgi:hypothetical protein